MVEIDIEDNKNYENVTCIDDLPNEEYHSLPSLSASQIKQLLVNPYAYVTKQKMAQTDAMNLGSAVHTLTLEPHKFDKEFAVMPKVDGRTAAGKEAKIIFERECQGKIVINQDQYEIAMKAAQSILNSPIGKLLTGGKAEASYFTNIDGFDVRVRPDYYREDIGVVFDVKTTQDASPDGFTKAIANYGYYIQDAFYLKALQNLELNANRFVFIAVETKEPFMVGIYELTPDAVDFGWSETKRAFEIYQNLDKYQEPVFKDTKSGDVIQTLTLPSYVYYKNNASFN